MLAPASGASAGPNSFARAAASSRMIGVMLANSALGNHSRPWGADWAVDDSLGPNDVPECVPTVDDDGKAHRTAEHFPIQGSKLGAGGGDDGSIGAAQGSRHVRGDLHSGVQERTS